MTAPTTPVRYVVADRRAETGDTASLTLLPIDEPVPQPQPGQFMMVTSFGVGEVPISVSGGVNGDGPLVHTIRAIGPVTRALHTAEPESVVGVRGPFGTSWGLANTDGRDLVFVAGGIGLAPLRPAIWAALHQRWHLGRVVVLVGARTPADLLFHDDLATWSRRPDVALATTVDQAPGGWRGNVGLVTALLRRANFEPARTTAFVCGPEVMMRVVARDLLARGVPEADVQLSLERNMRCGVALCGHCQLGPVLLCRDGPVVRLDQAASLMATRGL
jgi:NAD(P)H-flavin reductase